MSTLTSERAGVQCTECYDEGSYWTEWSDNAEHDSVLRRLVVERPDPPDGVVLIRCRRCNPPDPILAAQFWPTNADLIADVSMLGYLHSDDLVLDPTYGEGGWWKVWRPPHLVMHDLYKGDGIDFTALPEADDTYDVAAFDPPYVATGGRSTTTMPDFADRYGMKQAPKSPALLQVEINKGLAEMVRVVKRSKGRGQGHGVVLVKCQDYVSSGKLWPGTHYTLRAAEHLGLRLVDRFEHLSEKGRAQPKDRTKTLKKKDANGVEIAVEVPSEQKHAKRNLSTLFVFENWKKAKEKAGASQ